MFEILTLFDLWFLLLSVLQNGAALCREGINLRSKITKQKPHQIDYQSIIKLNN